MKTVKVTADNVVSIIDVDFDDFRDIQRAVGGHFEPVHTARMAKVFRPDIIMLVDEDGLMKGLPVNMLGCTLYGTAVHGNPIVGDLIFARAIGEDIVAAEDPERLKNYILKIFSGLKEEENEG